MKSNANGNSKTEERETSVKIMQNEVGQPMEVAMIPLVGKVASDSLVEFDLEALYRAQPELALGLIREMKGERDDQTIGRPTPSRW